MKFAPPLWRRRIRAGATALVATVGVSLLLAATAHAAAAWTVETSATTANLFGLTCFNFNKCLGVGALNSSNANYVYSSDGINWGTTGATSQQLNSITCVDAADCWMVGNAGTIAFTNNASIVAETSHTSVNLLGVACPDTLHCFAVGAKSGSNGVIDATTNGGTTWATQTSTGGQQLNAIDCSSATSCWAVGNAGVILHTANGTSWSTETSTTTVNLLGLSCPSASVCFAVGAKNYTNGVILATTHGGGTWGAQTSTGGQQLSAVDCPDTTHCWAVGNSGLVLATSNGTTWAAQTSNTTQALAAVKFVNDGFGWADGAGGVIDAFGCRAGGLNLTAPGSLTWPSTALAGTNQTITASAPVTVDDETAGFAGWSLSVTSTTFTNAGAKTLPTTAATLTSVGAAAGTGDCTMPTNAIAYPVVIPAAVSAPAAVKVFDSALDTGGGPVNLTLALNLTVPSKTVVGNYSSTWTFTVASGP